MIFFKKLFSALNKGGVRYLVVGGIAVNLYGIERSTADLDIVLKLERENIKRFIEAAKEMGLKPKIPVNIDDFADPEKRKGWIEEKGMMVFSLYDSKNPFFLLDIFVQIPFDFNEVYEKRKKLRFEDTIIPVVPIKDLIKMKEGSDRPQDRADIFYLKKIMEDWKDEE
ncbi:MAG: hypothetical protein AB1632_02870 [Nitrospirota bacterium]